MYGTQPDQNYLFDSVKKMGWVMHEHTCSCGHVIFQASHGMSAIVIMCVYMIT